MQENTSDKFSVVHTFEIKDCFYGENCLPDLNDLIGEAVRHPKAYGEFKSRMESKVINVIRRYLRGWQADTRVRLDITWGEKRKGIPRDEDNVVGAGRKIITDALVKAKTLADDNPRFLGYGKNNFVYTDKPFIRVEIVEIEDFKR